MVEFLKALKPYVQSSWLMNNQGEPLFGSAEAKLEPEDGYVKISGPGKSKPSEEAQLTSKASCLPSTMLCWPNNLYEKADAPAMNPAV